MTEDGPTTPGKAQRRRQEAARRLRDEGLKLIARQGLHACKVEEITRAAGLGKGTFFTHFASKGHFVAALVDHILGDVARRVRPLALAPDGAHALLAGVGAVHLRYFQLRPDAASLLVQAGALAEDSDQGQVVRQRLRQHVDMVAEMLRPAAAAVGWPVERAAELALMVVATSCGFFWFARPLGLGHDTPMALLERLGRAMAGGLAGGTQP